MQSQFTLLPFDEPRFWAKVNLDGPVPEHVPHLGPCWVWTAGTNEWGYGIYQLSRQHRSVKAHRYAYERTFEPIPPGLLVCHACDRPGCVNPAHLRLGTNRDNNHDMIRKGRAHHPGHSYGDENWTRQHPGVHPTVGKRGEENPRAILTEESVRAMRRRYAVGDISQQALAAEYGISQGIVNRILTQRYWAHVDDPDAPPAQPRIIVPPRGDARWGTKLTEDDVRAIRARYASGGDSLSQLAREYEMSVASISFIVNRKTWTHV